MEEKHSEEGTQMVRKRKLAKRSWNESKKMWEIAGPAVLASVSQFSIEFVSTAFVGHLGDVELAAVSLFQNVTEGFAYGVMLGMGSALETLSGQAVGAGQLNMLGIYMQKSWIISGVTALILTPTYVFASPILKLLRQDKHISELAGRYTVWVLPQLFAYAFNFPIQKFLQSQSRVWVMTIISIAAIGTHVLLNWILVTKLRYGLLGAAIAGDISWWLLVLAQAIYIFSGFLPDTWTGFSSSAFKSLAGFVKLSVASAVMQCLEMWYFTALILMVGRLRNPQTAVDAISICMNLDIWAMMVALGFNAAVSVRVSNELGAGNPKSAKLSILVTTLTSATLGLVFTIIILAFKDQFPKLFSDQSLVIGETSKLGHFVAATIFLDSIQPVLHGVAVGAGWQYLIAWINIGCYYVIGLPLGALLGYKFNLGVRGIWSGMLVGVLLQTIILLGMILRTDWNDETLKANERMQAWG